MQKLELFPLRDEFDQLCLFVFYGVKIMETP